jgi:hypothetical protein
VAAPKVAFPADTFFSRILKVVDSSFALPALPLIVQCSHEDNWGEAEGVQCSDPGTVHDLESEREFCARHFRQLQLNRSLARLEAL